MVLMMRVFGFHVTAKKLLLLAVLAVWAGMSVWAAGFHHHDTCCEEEQGQDHRCPVCVIALQQHHFLPILAAVILVVSTRVQIETLPARVTQAVCPLSPLGRAPPAAV